MRFGWVGLLACAGLVWTPRLIRATDVDGPDGGHDFYDSDDAPRGIPAYPDSTLGRFPRVYHVNNYDAWNMWLGGYPTDWGDSKPLYGVDSDIGSLASPDCFETAFGMTFDQDECVQDSTDMCLRSPVALTTCQMASFRIGYFVRVADRAYLNVLVDFNGDGDFADMMFCEATQDSVSEWAVKNYSLTGWGFPFELEFVDIPAFRVGPRPGPAWMRITLNSNDPVADDFHIVGDDHLFGGETEDYPIVVGGPVPVNRTSWGLLKSRYQ